MSFKILMVDDDKNICKVTNAYLKKDGYQVDFAHDGEEALYLFNKNQYDIIILDIMIPFLNGWEICKRIRETSNVPIVMLTAKGESHDKVEGLNEGADDYIVKPYDPNELLARIKALLRRSYNNKTSNDALVFGNLSVNPKNHFVSFKDKEIKLPKKEFQLLLFFLKNPNRVFSRNDLIENIWGWDFEGEDRVVDLYVKRIRKKISDNGEPWSIETVWGIGYQFKAVFSC